MQWTVIITFEFAKWLTTQSPTTQERLTAALEYLRVFGPSLGRPRVDTLKGSKIANLKELRIKVGRSPFRILFAFAPIRQAVILCGGDKSKEGDRRFYDRMILVAEATFARYLADLAREQGEG